MKSKASLQRESWSPLALQDVDRCIFGVRGKGNSLSPMGNGMRNMPDMSEYDTPNLMLKRVVTSKRQV